MTSETLHQPPPAETVPVRESLDPVFLHKNYEIKKRLFKLGTFDFTDGNGKPFLRAKRKLFRFSRKFNLYTYENDKAGKELLAFETRGRPPETYDVATSSDPDKREVVGSIRHNIGKSARSFFRTNWDILSPEGEIRGTLKRTKLRRYEIVTPDGDPVALLKHQFSPLGVRFSMSVEDNPAVDRRLLVAANVIMAERAFERKKKDSPPLL